MTATADRPGHSVLAYVPDLMDRSRVTAALPGVRFAATLDELVTAAPAAGVLLVDLDRPGVLDTLADLPLERAVGFGAHVEAEALARATDAGCRTVMTRRTLFRDVAGALGRATG